MKGKGSSQTPTVFYGYPAQTSLFGIPIKLLYGQNRISGDVIWTGDWQANAVSGGKGGKGGKGGSQYDYKTAIIVGLCMGPVSEILGIFVDKTILSITSTSNNITVPVSLQVTPTVAGGTFGSDAGVGQFQNFSVVANDFGSPGSTTLSGTQVIALEYVSGTPGPGQYTVDPTTGQYTFNAAQMNQLVQISYNFHQTSSSGTGDVIADFGFDFITGEQGQSPWGYISTHHPSQALGYTGLAYVANQLLDLGSSGVISNYSFEVGGLMQSDPGFPDANPYNVLLDFLTNPLYGVGFIPSEIGNPSDMTNYTLANNIFISPVITAQRAAREWINEWLLISNCEAVWSDGVMKLRSYGDKTAVANGVTFTPNTQPIYDIDDDHYICGTNEEPIVADRPSVRDANNDIPVEWANRGNQYTHETLREIDDLSIRLYGRRTASPLAYDCITRQDVAQTVAITQLRRSVYIRNQYQFKLGAVFALLEPMDILTITDLNMQLDTTPVRIIEITEDEDGTFTITAEEFPWSAASPTLFPKQVRAPYGPGYFAIPGAVNDPGFVDLPPEVSQGSPYQVGIALSGGPNWGGCSVHVSTDGGNSYDLLGKFQGPSTMGILTSALPSALDPDNTNTIAVDLTESFGALVSYTADQKDAFVSLLAIDDEIISFQTAAVTGTYKYNVTKLRRGVYGTLIGNHALGSTVMSLNELLFTWQYDSSVIGSNVYFKFTSFNEAGQNEENISNVAAFPFYVQGPRLPYPWNVGTFGQAPFSTTQQAILNYPRFTLDQNYTTNTDGTQQAALVIGGSIPLNTFSPSTAAPNVVMSTGNSGGTLSGGATYEIGVVTTTASGILPMIRAAIAVPSGTSTNVVSAEVSFTNPSTDSAEVFFTSEPEFGWTHVGTIAASTTLGMTANIVDNTTKSQSVMMSGYSCTISINGGDPGNSISRNGSVVGLTDGSGNFTYSITASGSGDMGEVWSAGTQSVLLNYTVVSITTMSADILDTTRNTNAVVFVGDPYTITIAGAPANTVVNVVVGSYANQVGTTDGNGVLVINGTMNDTPSIVNAVYAAGAESANLSYQISANAGKQRPVVVTAVGQMRDNQIVDESFDHLTITATGMPHAGIFGGQVYDITSNGNNTCTISLPGSTFAPGSLTGRILSLVGAFDTAVNTPIIDTPILSNTATTITVTDLTSPVEMMFPGDIIVIRTMATATSSTSITDSLWVNGGDPNHNTGLEPHAEIGNLVYIISGTGAGQDPRPISDNDTTTINVSVQFNPAPDITSIFVVLDPTIALSMDTNSFPNNKTTQTTSFNFPIQNSQGAMYFVQVFSVDANGTASAYSHSPFREIYVLGSGGERTIVATAGGAATTFDQLETDGHIYCDTTLNNIILQLLADQGEVGKLLLIEKTTADTNTVEIIVAPGSGDQFTGGGDDGATALTLSKIGDQAFLKF